MASNLSLKLLWLTFLFNFSYTLDIESERENLAIKMLSYMDTDADPCQDFYQYACGNYSKVIKGHEGVNMQSILKTSEFETHEILHELLMEPVSDDHRPNAVDQAKIYYQSCMKEPIFNFERSEVYVNFIEEEINSFFEIISSDYDWTKAVLKAKLYFGIDILFNFNNDLDELCFDVNFDLYDLNVKSFVSNRRKVNKDLVKKILKIYVNDDAEIKSIIKDIEKYQNQIMKIGIKSRDERFHNKEYMRDEDLSYYSPDEPDMNIPKNLREYSALVSTYNRNSQFLVCNYKYFRGFLSTLNKKRIRTITRYAIIKILIAFHLNEFESPKYQKSFCVETVKDVMKPVVNAIYFNSTHFDSDVEIEAKSMIEYLRKGFEDYIEASDWLDDETKAGAVTKIKAMYFNFGTTSNFDKILNDEKYLYLNFTKDKFYENRIKVLKFHEKQRTYEHDDYFHRNKDELKMDGSYYYRLNSVFIPAGLLKHPFINLNLPKSYNYATLGFFIAHEMTHSFDDYGRKFNDKREFHDWWSQESSQEFDRRTQCFIEQFSSYRVDYTNASLDGSKAVSENIADCGGIRRAFHGYNKWYRDNKDVIDPERESIPEFTNNELFFVSFAQLFCSEIKGMMYHYMSYQDHSVDKFRVIGSLANLNEFSDTYNCEIGSVLNREKKCVLW